VRRIPCGDSAASSAASLYFVWENNSWKRSTTWNDNNYCHQALNNQSQIKYEWGEKEEIKACRIC
jgi:hypothetical protein